MAAQGDAKSLALEKAPALLCSCKSVGRFEHVRGVKRDSAAKLRELDDFGLRWPGWLAKGV